MSANTVEYVFNDINKSFTPKDFFPSSIEQARNSFTQQALITSRAARYVAFDKLVELAGNENYSSFLNNPAQDIITFLETNYNYLGEENITTPEIQIFLGDFSVSNKKISTNTQLINEIGTIKEVSGQNDYTISISGILVAQNRFNNPDAEMIQLGNLQNHPISIPVQSDFLSNLGINYMMIESITYRSDYKTNNHYPITIKGVSDTPENKIFI
jgi:hypothetical protein